MAETAMKFGPEWLRALSHGSNNSPSIPFEAPLTKYKLAQYRYGREEMLALFTKDLKVPDELVTFEFLLADKCQFPLALLPTTEDEQRIWARSINSDVALRGSGKPATGPGNGIIRGGRGGSVDRGRGRGGRGGYYQRGVTFEDNEDGPPGGFARLRTLERSQSVNEKDQRWDDRDRRFERTFAGRSGVLEENNIGANLSKPELGRPPSDSWRRNEKDDDGGWRTAGTRGSRNSWRAPNDRDRARLDYDSKEKSQQNGPGKSVSHHPRQRSNSGQFWDSDMTGDNLPEWSVEEPAAVTDVVGTFDSSGAFMETKVAEQSCSSDDIYTSDDDDCVKKKGSPKAKLEHKPKIESDNSARSDIPSSKVCLEPKSALLPNKEETLKKPYVQSSSKVLCIDNSSDSSVRVADVPRTVKPNTTVKSNTHTIAQMQPKPNHPDDIPGPAEEDAFAHHKMATENMMAQWAEEDDQRVTSKSANNVHPLPSQIEDAQKWYYQDPQSDIQGPFTATEMCDWFKSGYFTDDLLVRRGCDEKFTRLGDFMSSLGGFTPFQLGSNLPPLRVLPIQTIPMPVPITQAAPAPVPQPAAQLSQSDNQLRLMQQQMFQQIMQQQMILRQAQYQQLLNQLKQQESFAKLSPQQQTQAVAQLLAQQVPMPPAGSVPDKPSLEANSPMAVPTVPFPLMGLPVPPVMKGDVPMWNVAPTPVNWPLGQSSAQTLSTSIWDTEVPRTMPIEVSELEKKLAAEEDEKRRQALEAVKKLEEEKKRREEEEQRQKEEAERILKEIKLQQEEEKRRQEELKRLKEEEQRREEELRRLEEKRKEEEKRLEELRKQEESRKAEEKRLLAEQKEEQRRKEIQRLEELRLQEEIQKKQKEQERLQELKQKEEEALRLREQQAAELRAQREAEKQRELERRRHEKQQQELLQNKEIELQQRKEGPVWAVTNHDLTSGEMSLSDIQKLQEKKEKEEKMRLLQIQHQKLLMHQQSQYQANKNGLSWAKRSSEAPSSVKSLMEIQQEEAQRAAQQQQQQKAQKTAAITVQVTAATGVWGNSSQLNRASLSQVWNSNNSGFWDEPVKNAAPVQKPTKNCDSAFPALSNSAKSPGMHSNKNKNVRAKKDEDAVLKIFEAQKKPTDEFTAWCVEALSNLNSSVDVPTFVAFLKDVESPYEVHDYVKSYLGEGKDAKEFGRQFLERRSKFRNQAKQAKVEENMWGPAPAITPSVKSCLVNDTDSTAKGKARKKKNKMHKLDNSMLGFTVQPNPDRINVGEIDRIEGI